MPSCKHCKICRLDPDFPLHPHQKVVSVALCGLWSVSVNLCFLALPASRIADWSCTHFTRFTLQYTWFWEELKDQHIDLKVCTQVFLQYRYKTLNMQNCMCKSAQEMKGKCEQTNISKAMGIIDIYSSHVQMCKTGLLWLPVRIHTYI